jgi:rubrerythrin/VIT1/CCC1 family predicted Fe2+/Mn2+ transporter
MGSKTDANLQVALAGEADANRRYIAYGIQAFTEGYPDIAQLFFEAAGAETIHALNHLRVLGAVHSTRENLMAAAYGEDQEIEEMYPRMIREAEEEGRQDAAEAFRLSLDRERHHREMFRAALEKLNKTISTRSTGSLLDKESPKSRIQSSESKGQSSEVRSQSPESRGQSRTDTGVKIWDLGSKLRGIEELETEPSRIERLSNIREVIFGAQDALVSTFSVVAGLAAAETSNHIVFLAGAISAMAGILSMSAGTFLSSRAQRQVYEAELAKERREIREKPGEEIAELMAALVARGMSRNDAVEVTRRIGRHSDLLLEILAVFELGLAPQRLGTPVRDALIMAAAFGGASLIPLFPFLFPNIHIDLAISGLLTLTALFVMGTIKAALAGLARIRSGIEVMVVGAGSGLIGYALGRIASLLLGVNIG